MALKRLGAEYIDGTTNAVDTPILVYTVGTGKQSLASSIGILNTGASEATVTVWIIEAGGAVSPPDEKNRILSGSLANDGFPIRMKSDAMEAGGKIYFQSDIVGVNLVVSGDET